jgi:hypothetical protein
VVLAALVAGGLAGVLVAAVDELLDVVSAVSVVAVDVAASRPHPVLDHASATSAIVT